MQNKGFTLVELIIGIVVLAVAMLVMNTLLISQSKDALEPLYRLRASQLGQSVLQDILSRGYDEYSDHSGGYYRCGEIWGNSDLWFDGTDWQTTATTTDIATKIDCSDVSNYGIDSTSSEVLGEHQDFNDVDDFITDGFESAIDYGDVLGNNLSSQYNNYSIKVEVNADTTTLTDQTLKRIDITIQTPSNEKIVFSALKGNY
jgi:MSHA pilin protein MshD